MGILEHQGREPIFHNAISELTIRELIGSVNTSAFSGTNPTKKP